METINRSKSHKSPLVLIHDGGGTTASYHALINLDHDIYGIENPLFHASKPWKGGIRAMARAYSALVELELGQTCVILGGSSVQIVVLFSLGLSVSADRRMRCCPGWSFGGLVALEMVDILQNEYSINVQGVLLLDSVCPASWKLSPGRYDYQAVSAAYAACLSSKLLVMNMIKHSTLMAEQWQAPQWQSTIPNQGGNNCSCGQYFSPSGVMGMSSPRGPPVVLVRCLDRLNLGENATARVDISRDCDTLGWEHSRPGLVSHTLECSANHFNLFAKDFVSFQCEVMYLRVLNGFQVHETTEKIREALVIMESEVDGFT